MFQKTPKQVPNKRFTVGRNNFAKISEVEGIHLTNEMKADFRSFDEKKLPASKRREVLSKKYA